jgi:hypothetical protein
MFYAAYNNKYDRAIAVAYSDDGINWTNDQNNPIIEGYWLNPTTYSWSNAEAPSILRDGDTYYLWYSNALDLCLATNKRVHRLSGSINSNTQIMADQPADITPNWKATMPARTNLTARLRLSHDNVSWSGWVNVTSGKSYSPSDFTMWGPYFQYSVSMNTSDPNATPVLSDFRVDYCPLLSSGEILGLPVIVPDGSIVSAHPILNITVPAGCSIELYLTTDNGTTWDSFQNNTQTNFTTRSNFLRWKIKWIGDGNLTPFLNGLQVNYTVQHLPSEIAIDIGVDGTDEWQHLGLLEGTEPAQGLTSVLDAYLAAHRSEADAEGYVTIPISISSDTGGTVVLGNTAADWAPFPKVLAVKPQGADLSLDTPINISFGIPMNAASAENSIVITPAITVTASWSADGRNLKLSHTGLQENTTYNVTVASGALSSEGATLQANHSWEFRTVLLPRVASFLPGGGGNPYVNTEIKIGFNKPMNQSSVETALSIDPPAVLRNLSWNSGSELRLIARVLEPDTNYNFSVGTGALDLLGFHVPAVQNFGFKTMPVPIGLPDTPNITGFGPTGTGIAVKPIVTISFDRQMNSSSVFSAISFDPFVDLTGFMKFNTTYNFTLGAELLPGKTYIVMVNSSARGYSGKYLMADFAWSFTTMAAGVKDIQMPMVDFTDPPDRTVNVDSAKVITIGFNEWMDKDATFAAINITPKPQGNWNWFMEKGFILQFQPYGPLGDAKYRIRINASIAKDESGNVLDGNQNGVFDNERDDFTLTFVVGRPHLLQKYPASDQKDLATDAQIRLEFDRPINLTALKSAISIVPEVSGIWTLDGPGKVAIFTPSTGFNKGTTYSIVLKRNVTDIDGIEMGSDVNWLFTTVKAPPPVTQDAGFPWWILAAVMVLIVVGIGAYAYSRRKKVPSPPVKEEAIGTETPAQIEENAIPTEPETEPEPPMATVVTEAPGSRTPLPSVPPVPVITTAPEGFAVEDIFLMYRDGRLIHHTTRRIKADMDVDIVTSMLTAVQAFVKESIGKHEGAELGSMEYGGSKILFENGKFIIIAAVIIGGEPAGFRDEMKAAVRDIESEFGTVLPTWDGTTQKLAGAKRFLGQLGTYKPVDEVAGEKAKADVSLKAELEFYQGFVRLKVAVKNNMRTMIAGTAFKLIFDEAALKLYSIEPELERRGDEIVLGIVGAREKKAVAFYLDPQICTESYIEGVLTYKDAEGNLEMIKMPKKLTSVVCPILFTEENINTAMLKRMAMEELDKKDTKVFAVPAMIGPQRAFEIGKAAIQHHDLRLVRELKNEKPYEAEAWYYGKAKGREEKVIVRARVIADRNFLEFFVASNSTLMLTGMLAELKSDLNKEIETRKVRMGMKQVTDQKEVDAMTTIRTLLEKATNAEIEAGDTEAR